MHDQDVCKMHGGKAPQNLAAAERRRSERQHLEELSTALREAFGDKVPDVDPADAMLEAIAWKRAEVIVLRSIVADLGASAMVWGTTRTKSGGEDYGTTREARANVWWTMLRSAEDQLVRWAHVARSDNVDERRTVLAEQVGVMLASAIGGILRGMFTVLEAALEANPAAAAIVQDTWERAIAEVVPAQLRALAAGEEPTA